MNDFWDALIGDHVRAVSNRLDLGPNGPKVIGQLLAMLAMVVFVLFALAFIGGGPSWWFVLLFLSPLGLAMARTLRSARADLTSGSREGPTDDQL